MKKITSNNKIKPIKVINEKNEKQSKNIYFEILYDYFSNTTLHGINYFTHKNKTIIEKIWWGIMFLISMSCCIYLIFYTWLNWKNNPVILTFAQEQTSIWKIPFPAITICPISKIAQLSYNYTYQFQNKNKLNPKEYKKLWDISLVCDIDYNTMGFSDPMINFTDNEAITNIVSVVRTKKSTFGQVIWQNNKHNDNRNMFAEQITEEGVCFTFNSLSQEEMYTKLLDQNVTYINHNTKNTGWSIESGYNSKFSPQDYPRRTAENGQIFGISFFLVFTNVYVDYLCGMPLSGYKVILHNPAEVPKSNQQYILAGYNQSMSITVSPELITTTPSLVSLSPDIRKCYFSHEKTLRYFRVYTQSNCQTECLTNMTEKICKCIPFYMPRENKTKICGYSQMECVYIAEKILLKYETEQSSLSTILTEEEKSEKKIYDICNCLQPCFSLSYNTEISRSEVNLAKDDIAAGIATQQEREMFERFTGGQPIFTEIFVFFKESEFLPLVRGELYDAISFFANVGGLLSLFMGFSLLSIVEILYYISKIFVRKFTIACDKKVK